MKNQVLEIFNEAIKDGLEDNELLLTYSYRNKVESINIHFETEYQLQEFRELQPSYFDKDGKAYTGTIFDLNMAERMLKLINQLESKI